MRRTVAVSFVALACACSCGDGSIDAREAQIAGVMAAADEPIIRTRPKLAAGKYVKMARAPYDFFRGTVPLYRSDLRTGATRYAASRFALDMPLVPSLGDPHPENFGVLRAADGTATLEPNDFDAAEREPYLWDVRRLAAGMALATLLSNADDPTARAAAIAAEVDVVSAAIAGYRDGIEAAANGAPPGRVVEGMGGPVADDLFRRSERDRDGRELDELTVIDASGARRLRRGAIDDEDPQSVHASLPPAAIAALPDAIERWRRSLIVQPPSADTSVLDAVRVFGGGVASWPRVRVLVLLRGPTTLPDDDVLVELKEIADPAIGGLVPPGLYADSLGERVVNAARASWSRLDGEPLWGFATWLGLPCQIRRESEGQKGVSVDRLAGEEGTPEALAMLGAVLGGIVARVHAPEATAIRAAIAKDRDGFVAEQVQVGREYAALALEDHARFLRVLRRRDGLRLGIPFDPTDAPPPDLAAVFGAPPEVPALP
ncbi:MAG: DUF2252 family protein [Labilithrix sp.]|nr:DUF2252 family protein [Labilithrix sp.]MCW5816261.1 DUF2252 family protein [Labilithrix sp.]